MKKRFTQMWKWLLLPIVIGLLAAVPLLVEADDPLPTATPENIDPRFGAIESFWAPEEAAELDVGWERILFYWNEIQPEEPDDWNTLHVLEEWLVEADAQDRTVVGLLKNTPAWATDGEPFSGVPRGLYLPIDDPDNLWANYVKRVVTYYGPRGVHNWIIWNEPEIKADVYGHEFDGSVRDYVRLLEVAYLVANENDPEVMIHLAGYSYWHDPYYLNEIFKAVKADPDAADHNYYFDAISLHIYFRVETVGELVHLVDLQQMRYDLDKPIWINETNASPNIDPWWPVERPIFPVDLDQQAWYIVQAHALGFGEGADRIGVYKLIDIFLQEGGESFGILRPDKSKRPAFVAYQTTIDQLRDFEGRASVEKKMDSFTVTFTWPNKVTRVLWAREDNALTMTVPALLETAVLVDAFGNEQTVTAEEGFYTIDLDGARCPAGCDIGGPPVFLVEEGATVEGALPRVFTRPIRATLTATPETTLTYTPWPTLTGTPSPEVTATFTPTSTETTAPTQPPSTTPTATETVTATATTTATTTATVEPTGTVEPTAAVLTEAPADAGGPTTWWFWGAALIVAFVGGTIVIFRRGG